MARSIEISLPPARADAIIADLHSASGIVSISVLRGGSIKPPGDVLSLQTTNEGFLGVLRLLADYDIGNETSIVSSEPRSLVSPSNQGQIDQETNEASWPEMASLLRRETNVTVNYLMAMFFAGIVAAVGLWTDTVHIVVGAMVIAPGFEPIIRVPFGLLANGNAAWRQGLTSTASGYAALLVGAAAAFLLQNLLQGSQPALHELQWVQYWTKIGFGSVLVALAAGAAGAAIIAAQRSVLSAGVMIALALIPTAAIVGMAVTSGEFGLAGSAFLRWSVEVTCVFVAGGTVFLLKRRWTHSGTVEAEGSA